MTLVERKTGYLLVGKLSGRTVAETNRATIELIKRHPGAFKTITSDNGTEFHGYEEIERATGVRFYFATPHHSWERGTKLCPADSPRRDWRKTVVLPQEGQNGDDEATDGPAADGDGGRWRRLRIDRSSQAPPERKSEPSRAPKMAQATITGTAKVKNL